MTFLYRKSPERGWLLGHAAKPVGEPLSLSASWIILRYFEDLLRAKTNGVNIHWMRVLR